MAHPNCSSNRKFFSWPRVSRSRAPSALTGMRNVGRLLFLALASCGGSSVLLQSEAGTEGGGPAVQREAGITPDGCISPTAKNFYDYKVPSAACTPEGTCPAGATALPASVVDYAYGCRPAGAEAIICARPFCPLPPDASADGGTATTCANAATTEACVMCCRQAPAPNYGGFELYAYETCTACPSCNGFSPCGTNTTPPAGQTCVACLQAKLAATGVPPNCMSDDGCTPFAACLRSCPLR